MEELHYIDEPDAGFVDRRAKVWLECNGEPYDHRSVSVMRTGQLVHGITSVTFRCPKCGRPHRSLLFR